MKDDIDTPRVTHTIVIEVTERFMMPIEGKAEMQWAAKDPVGFFRSNLESHDKPYGDVYPERYKLVSFNSAITPIPKKPKH